MKFNILVLSIFIVALPAEAKLKVVTTTTTLAEFVKEVGGNLVDVTSLTTANQDPHFVEAKPSYMVKLSRADLLVTVGLDLEVGWIGNVQRGAKNPAILDGGPGFFAAGDYISPIELPSGKIDRAQGDVHAKGNPHFHLDPDRALKVSLALAKKLGTLDPQNSAQYWDQGQKFADTLKRKTTEWQARLEKTGIKGVITYHKSRNYFLDRFGIKNLADIEPLPGVPPTAKHIQSLLELVRNQSVRCILNESYFETTAAERLKKESSAKFEVVPVEVSTNYVDLIDALVKAIETCGGSK